MRANTDVFAHVPELRSEQGPVWRSPGRPRPDLANSTIYQNPIVSSRFRDAVHLEASATLHELSMPDGSNYFRVVPNLLGEDAWDPSRSMMDETGVPIEIQFRLRAIPKKVAVFGLERWPDIAFWRLGPVERALRARLLGIRTHLVFPFY